MNDLTTFQQVMLLLAFYVFGLVSGFVTGYTARR